jgi:hypothetical protein
MCTIAKDHATLRARNSVEIPLFHSGSLFVKAVVTSSIMKVFLSLILWCILLAVCWPIALIVLFLFPFVWLLLLPFRIVGLSIDLIFKLVGAILMFPFRLLSKA